MPGDSSPEKVDSDTKDDDNDDDPGPYPGNKGKLQMDATVCDADIKYPTDLDLLNGSRQKAEELIDELCLKLGIKDKPRTYRRVARKDFLNVSKMKRKPANVLRQAIRKQINYLKRDIRNINKMLDTIRNKPIPFERRQLKSRADTENVKSDGKRRNAIRLKESLVRASVVMV